MPDRLEISPKTLLWVGAFLIGGWLVVQIRDILVLMFIAFIFMSALSPAVEKLQSYKLPRFLAIMITYLFMIGVLVGFGTLVFPPLVYETGRFLNALPQYLEQLTPVINVNLDTFIAQIAPVGQNVVRVTVGIFSNIVTLFTVAVFIFYFLLERHNLRHFLEAFVGVEMGDKVIDIIRQIERRLGAWVRGQLLLMLIIGLVSYVGLLLLGIPYPLPLALIAGLFEVVPIIGPIISAVPAIAVAFFLSPLHALLVVLLYFLIQQLENNLIVPSVMQRAVGLPPLASLVALMIGGRLAGTIGIILAVPVLLVLQTILKEVVKK